MPAPSSCCLPADDEGGQGAEDQRMYISGEGLAHGLAAKADDLARAKRKRPSDPISGSTGQGPSGSTAVAFDSL